MKTHIVPFRIALLVALAMTALFAFDVSPGFAQGGNSAAPKKEKFNYIPISQAPEKARALHNPFENDPDALRAGHKLFENYCVECHGKVGQGGERAPSLLRPEVQQAPPGAIFWILSNGVVRHGMPDWARLPPQQRWQIIRFVRSFTHPEDEKQ